MNAKVKEVCEILNATSCFISDLDILKEYHLLAKSVSLVGEGWVPHVIQVEGVTRVAVSFFTTLIELKNGSNVFASKFGLTVTTNGRLVALEGHTALVISEGEKVVIVVFAPDEGD